jgi:hypothetical protein
MNKKSKANDHNALFLLNVYYSQLYSFKIKFVVLLHHRKRFGRFVYKWFLPLLLVDASRCIRYNKNHSVPISKVYNIVKLPIGTHLL